MATADEVVQNLRAAKTEAELNTATVNARVDYPSFTGDEQARCEVTRQKRAASLGLFGTAEYTNTIDQP